MSAAARDLAVHLARQLQVNPDLAYLIGPGSRTWELWSEALGDITGETAATISARYQERLPQGSTLAASRDLFEVAGDSLNLVNDLIAGIGVSDDRLQLTRERIERAIAKAEGRA